MLLIALAVKLDSKGPVFFRQRRHGFNHKIIEVLKFRTMTVQEDGSHIPQATRNDPRVTRIGRFLRRTSLDELPQFYNVLTGEMSVVGPRPHAVAHNDYYSKLLNNYVCRHRVKPGITGWAQINQAYDSCLDDVRSKVRLDLEYVQRQSITHDLRIMSMTLPVMLFRKGGW
jgi:putative colanic acid biosynthesis UDP-glucose lipid carrier transferase